MSDRRLLGGGNLIDRIVADIKAGYGIVCHQVTPIDGGWQNRLWRAQTDGGDILIKQYSGKRFRDSQLHAIDTALLRQVAMTASGIPCPRIYLCGGHALRWIEDATVYAVMDFCPGQNEHAGTITHLQMESLGSVCAQMQNAFARLSADAVKGYPIDCGQVYRSLWENFDTRRQDLRPQTPLDYSQALLAQEPILRQLDESFFRALPKGIAHEDFTSDNILFDKNGVSAVIDFDRNQYGFVWHDIGRAILSFALEEQSLNTDKIRAFRSGYTQYRPLSPADIGDALRITWCIEALWWIQPAYFAMESCKATQYREELVWLTDHWSAIDSICRGI